MRSAVVLKYIVLFSVYENSARKTRMRRDGGGGANGSSKNTGRVFGLFGRRARGVQLLRILANHQQIIVLFIDNRNCALENRYRVANKITLQ